ncbi:hypothetical protein DOTSEDRAFT_43453 [Dothistroma septosporum NZE10]|uniref:Uncharacterized protein n=1 Tax=Dothistroma septosporum (strain NZE10 / CBS 128990) TaxID=675120 RepID=N1PQ30_DOTSN|nr:hypothetical protein DOTSEDRAFT_43453 [Dothistroma septosporum NZE10]
MPPSCSHDRVDGLQVLRLSILSTCITKQTEGKTVRSISIRSTPRTLQIPSTFCKPSTDSIWTISKAGSIADATYSLGLDSPRSNAIQPGP